MKKTLIAVAALAATGAFAQNVYIDGGYDAGYQSISYKGTGVTDIGGNGSYTSQINFRGSEDLGSGMKAVFRVETDFSTVSSKANTGFDNNAAATTAPTATNPASGGTCGNGELRVGLTGGWGALHVGNVNYNGLFTTTAYHGFGTAIGSGFRGVITTDAGLAASSVRSDNSVMYVSPDMAGFQVTLYNSFKNTNSDTTNYSSTIGAYNHQGVQEIGVNYANGPIAVSFSNLTTSFVAPNATGDSSTTTRTLSGSYTLGNGLKIGGQNQNTKTGSVQNRTFNSVAVTYPMGNIVLLGMYGTGSDSGDNASATATPTGVATLTNGTTTLTSFGADYMLSKRTAVYLRYESISDTGNWLGSYTSATDGIPTGTNDTRTRTALGIRATF